MKTFETIPLNSREVLVILSGDDGYQNFKVINKELPTRLLSRCEIRDVRGYSREFSGIAHIERTLKIPDGIDIGSVNAWIESAQRMIDLRDSSIPGNVCAVATSIDQSNKLLTAQLLDTPGGKFLSDMIDMNFQFELKLIEDNFNISVVI